MTTPDMPQAITSAVLCSPWATPADLPERYRSMESDENWERHLLRASEILWMLSGRRWYGQGCTAVATLRALPRAGDATWPYHDSWGSCGCVTSAYYALSEHHRPFAIQLPHRARTITSVLIDGATLAAPSYRLTRAGWLERLDGQGWPMCGDSTVITYTYGEAPPASGVGAVVEFAIQLYLAEEGDGACQLPLRVQSITREGVSMAMIDPMEFLDKGRTGLYGVDLWLGAVNPKSRTQRATVWTPGSTKPVRG